MIGWGSTSVGIDPRVGAVVRTGCNGVLPRLALASAFAVGLYLPALGVAPPDSCVLGTGIAGAAPSPSCGGDLRECLRQSADMRQTNFGGRYVTADDVARCMETFNACIHGGSGTGGGNTQPSTSPSTAGGGSVLPQRFRTSFPIPGAAGTIVGDCRRSGNDITCTEALEPQGDGSTWTGEVTASLSGMTATGTKTARLTSPGTGGCSADYRYSGPITMSFGADGSATMRWGPADVALNWGGICSTSRSETAPVMESTGSWS